MLEWRILLEWCVFVVLTTLISNLFIALNYPLINNDRRKYMAKNISKSVFLAILSIIALIPMTKFTLFDSIDLKTIRTYGIM